MSSPIINTEGTRSSSSSSNSYGSAIDSTARSMEVHIASSIAQSTSQQDGLHVPGTRQTRAMYRKRWSFASQEVRCAIMHAMFWCLKLHIWKPNFDFLCGQVCWVTFLSFHLNFYSLITLCNASQPERLLSFGKEKNGAFHVHSEPQVIH